MLVPSHAGQSLSMGNTLNHNFNHSLIRFASQSDGVQIIPNTITWFPGGLAKADWQFIFFSDE